MTRVQKGTLMRIAHVFFQTAVEGALGHLAAFFARAGATDPTSTSRRTVHPSGQHSTVSRLSTQSPRGPYVSHGMHLGDAPVSVQQNTSAPSVEAPTTMPSLGHAKNNHRSSASGCDHTDPNASLTNILLSPKFAHGFLFSTTHYRPCLGRSSLQQPMRKYPT